MNLLLMNELDLTVIVPNFNHGAYIPDRLLAILKELPPKSELLLVDDGSKDDSIAKASRIEDPRLRLLPLPQNGGVEAAFNEGTKQAKGKYVVGLAMDDILLEGGLTSHLEALLQHPEVSLCASQYSVLYEKNDQVVHFPVPTLKTTQVLMPKQVFKLMRAHDFYIGGILILAKRESFLKYEGLKKEGSDWFLYRVIALSEGMIYIPQTYAIWKCHEKNYSLNRSEDTRKKWALSMLEMLARQPFKAVRPYFRASHTLHSFLRPSYLFPRHLDFLFAFCKRSLSLRFKKHLKSLKKRL